MLRDEFKIFDDILCVAGEEVTSSRFARRLARYDQVALFAVVQNLVSSDEVALLDGWIEHSVNGVDWIAKNTTHELQIDSLWAGQVTHLDGYDDGVLPTLPYARLKLKPDSLGPLKLHVRVYVALRDLDEASPEAPDDDEEGDS